MMSVFARLHPVQATYLPPEIAFLIDTLSVSALERASALARSSGTDAATALLNAGLASEDVYYRALARHIGATFVENVEIKRASHYLDVIRSGSAALASPGRHSTIVAPRGHAIARLIERCDGRTVPPAVTTPTRLRSATFARHADEIAVSASDELANRHPEWSCRPGPAPLDLALLGAVIALVLAVAHLPTTFGLVLLAALQLTTLAMLALRLASALVRAPVAPSAEAVQLADDRLPTYTVIVALYREAKVVPRLIHTLAKLDYPASKLQIMFVLEADDAETRAIFEAAPLPARFEVLIAPEGQPRTKPRALNVALELARGDLLVVYDAEDIVDPLQLRHSASVFARSPRSLAAIQGRLVIDNHDDGFIPKLFAIEYSALFDVLGPALSAWRVPVPLGGTSTHFRTRVLRELHGWDAWNVTEDADLGMRLALAGYHVGDLPSSTFEEALKHPKPWLRQRTRWMKGFLQTSFTHARRPRETIRRLGVADAFCALTLLPGTVLSALVYPFLTLLTAWRLAFGATDLNPSLLSTLTTSASILVLLGGAAAMIIPGTIGCLRRGWTDLLRYVPLLPIYFLLVSLAAWLAVFELARHPHRWNKTEHGLSRTSRSGALQLKRSGGLKAAATTPRPSVAAAVPSSAR